MSTDTDKLKQKQKVRKYLVFTGMFLLFLGCMWLIFAPSEKDRQEEERKAGFNAELPDRHETQAGGEDAHVGRLLRPGR